MSNPEVKRRTERVDEVMEEMLADSDAALATVARAVRDVNETLAVHAAWTDERFEAVDDRLVSLARIQVMTASKVEIQIAGIDARMLGFGVSQSSFGQTLSKVDQNQGAFMQGHVAVFHKLERLEQGQEVLQQGQATLVEAMQGLTTQVREVLALAITGEMKDRLAGNQPATS